MNEWGFQKWEAEIKSGDWGQAQELYNEWTIRRELKVRKECKEVNVVRSWYSTDCRCVDTQWLFLCEEWAIVTVLTLECHLCHSLIWITDSLGNILIHFFCWELNKDGYYLHIWLFNRNPKVAKPSYWNWSSNLIMLSNKQDIMC